MIRRVQHAINIPCMCSMREKKAKFFIPALCRAFHPATYADIMHTIHISNGLLVMYVEYMVFLIRKEPQG